MRGIPADSSDKLAIEDRGLPTWAVRIQERTNAANGRHTESVLVEMVSPSWLLGDAQEKSFVHEEEVLAVSRGSWAGKGGSKLCGPI